MPLIIPTPNPTSPQETWMIKLLGKKITDDASASDDLSFAKQDLPKEHRIMGPGDVVAGDWNPERLNVHLGDDGTVRHVEFK